MFIQRTPYGTRSILSFDTTEMDAVKPLESLKLTGNVDISWRTFKQQFTLYMQAVGLDDKSDSRKIALLLTVAGPQAI